MSTLAERIDATTVTELRRRGSQKWADAHGGLGAWIAEMDFGVAPVIEEALAEAADRGFYGYPPTSLAAQLRTATAEFLADSTGWDVLPSQVAEVSDVIHALALAISRFTSPGSAIVLPTPAYMPFLDLPGALGRELRQVPLTRDSSGWHLDLDRLDAALDGAGLLVWVNPHNPIGKTYTVEETQAVVDLVARHRGLRVFSDEIHAPLLYDGGRHVPYASVGDLAAEQAITAVSASKMWNLAGLKCAQLVFTNPSDERAWASGVGRTATHPSTPGMVASIAAYRDGGPWRTEILAYLETNRRLVGEAVAERMPGVDVWLPDATYLAFLDFRSLPMHPSPQEFLLEQARVCYTDGALCGDAGAGFIRANFATPRRVLAAMLEQTGEAVQRLRSGS